MTIATWNLECLKHKKNLYLILEEINKLNPDILILTEYDEQVELDYPYQLATEFIAEEIGVTYKPTERRVKLFSRYEIIQQIETFNKNTSLCVELKTPKGDLIVYGTIIGILGNRHENFNEDLVSQIDDFKRLGANKHFCVAGDFNISFSDGFYFTKAARESLFDAFDLLNMNIATKDIKNNIDHIAISNQFLQNIIPSAVCWNEKTKDSIPILSDHMGICIKL